MELKECNEALLLGFGNGTDGMKCGIVIWSGEWNWWNKIIVLYCGTVIGSGEWNCWNVIWHCYWGRGMEQIE